MYTTLTLPEIVTKLANKNILVQAWDYGNNTNLEGNEFGSITFTKDLNENTELINFIIGANHRLEVTLNRYKIKGDTTSYSAVVDTVVIGRTTEAGKKWIQHVAYNDNNGTQRGVMKLLNRLMMTAKILNK